MTKIVINTCYGGFALSEEASRLVNKRAKLKGDDKIDPKYGFIWSLKRDNPILVQVVEELGDASGRLAKLKIIEIPDNIEYEIDDYDGIESIHEKHEVWS